MTDIRTHFEALGRVPQPGYEWSAGVYPQRIGRLGGRVGVRLTQLAWEVIHVIYRSREPNLVQVLESFPIGDDGERAAKKRAVEIFAEYSQA